MYLIIILKVIILNLINIKNNFKLIRKLYNILLVELDNFFISNRLEKSIKHLNNSERTNQISPLDI